MHILCKIVAGSRLLPRITRTRFRMALWCAVCIVAARVGCCWRNYSFPRPRIEIQIRPHCSLDQIIDACSHIDSFRISFLPSA